MKTFSDFAEMALTIESVKSDINVGKNVVMYMVSALAPRSHLEVVTVTPLVFNKYEPSDIGEQIGYMTNDGIISRSFVSDVGLDHINRYNRHLCFSSLADANEYMEYVANSTILISEQEELNMENDMLDEIYLHVSDYDYFDNY